MSFAIARSSVLASLWNFLLAHPYAALRNPRLLRKVVAESMRWKRLNPGRREMATRGEGMIVEDRHRFEFAEEFYASPRDRIQVEKYYIEPRKQADQLEAVGFRDVRIFGPDGQEVRAKGRLAQWWWLYYLCTKLAEPGPERDSGHRFGPFAGGRA